MTKLTKDQYYLNIAKTVAEKSTCLNVEIGCVIEKADQIIATGYVGAPRKTKDCVDLGFCIRRKNNIESGRGYEMCRSVHAEMNALINAARAGVSVLDGNMYVYAGKRTDSEARCCQSLSMSIMQKDDYQCRHLQVCRQQS